MSVPINVTAQYQAQIVALIKGGITTPLLSNVAIEDGNLSDIMPLDSKSDSLAVFRGAGHGTVNNTDGITKVPTGLSYDIEFKDTNYLTSSQIQGAVKEVMNILARTVETHLLYGNTSLLPDSPINGAFAQSKGDNFDQTFNSIMLLRNNDFTPRSIPAYELKSFKAFEVAGAEKGVVIAPEKAHLVGSLVPEIGVWKDVRSNRVKVVGLVQVSGGFSSADCLKFIK